MKKILWLFLICSIFSSCSIVLGLLTGTHVDSQTCHTCHGDGKCNLCRGSGVQLIVEGSTPKSVKCSNCSKGKCPTCGGTGTTYTFEDLNRY